MPNEQNDLKAEAQERNFSVLLVEDDEDVFHFVKRSLLAASPFPSFVDHACNFEEALSKLQQRAYHLLLVESEVASEPGLNLLDQIQGLGISVPFILMTPVQDDTLAREALKRGAADLIVKSQSQFQELSEKLMKSYQEFKSKHQGATENKKFFHPDPQAEKADFENQRAFRDELTGLYNHSYLHDRIVNEFSRASRYQYPISCLLIDIDHFKDINQQFGHQIGESVLKECASLLFDNSRLSDFVARYGGEEFAVILPHVNYDGARELASRLRLLFAKHTFLEKTQAVHLTVSIGIASFPEDPFKQRGELLSFANQALLRSKAAGRNCVTLYRDIEPVLNGEFPVIRISEEKVAEFQSKIGEIMGAARRGYMEASKTLILALEAKDPLTVGHSATVGKYSLETAEIMGMTGEEAEMVQHAAMLHDIGKICIPDEILLKPARLTLAEYEAMKQHAYLGFKILKTLKFLQHEAVFVLHHHEWFNGEGYPCRLKGTDIPLGARIIAVTDTYDTIRTAGGRYKKTATAESTVNELINCAGTQFDPEVVKAFIEVLKRRGEIPKDFTSERLDQALAAFPRK